MDLSNTRSKNPQEPTENQDSSGLNETAQKKKCCGEHWKPFFPVERDQPTMMLRTKGPTKTIYQRDYPKHPLEQTRNMKNDLWTTFQNQEPMDFTTTMRNDFKPLKVTNPVGSTAKRPVTNHVPFGGKSAYRREYVDWKGNQAMMTLPVQPSTVISNLPFLKRTTYGDDFMKPAKEDDLNDQLRNVNKQKKDSALFPVMPLLGQTTYQKAYKGFKVAGLPNGPRSQEPFGNTAYPGQYQTLTQAEFTDPRKKFSCPYRDQEALETK